MFTVINLFVFTSFCVSLHWMLPRSVTRGIYLQQHSVTWNPEIRKKNFRQFYDSNVQNNSVNKIIHCEYSMSLERIKSNLNIVFRLYSTCLSLSDNITRECTKLTNFVETAYGLKSPARSKISR